MNILNEFIYGYDITVIRLLTPIAGFSFMLIFAIVFFLLSRRTNRAAYIISFLTLEFLAVYNIVSLVIIFLGIYGIYPEIANRLYVFNNILILILIVSLPINTRTFLRDVKMLNAVNNVVFIVVSAVVLALLIVSAIRADVFFNVSVNYNEAGTSYYLQPEGLFYIFRMYVIFFAIAASLLTITLDMILNNVIGLNSLFMAFSLLGLFLILRDIMIFGEGVNSGFDRTGLAITLQHIVRTVSVFVYFTQNSLRIIRSDNILTSRLKSNLSTLTSISKTSESLNLVDKSLMDYSMFAFELDRETKDALDAVNAKIEAILEAKNKLDETKERKKEIIRDGIKFTNTVFTFFDRYKNQLQENCQALNGSIDKIKGTDYSRDEIISLSEDLKNIRKNLNETFKKFIDEIIESSSQFKDINAISGEIYETIEYIRNITNETNLLSINAGIQASKAGESGRSFSVVAKEIGGLSFEISKDVESVEKILIEIFSGLVLIENSSFYIEERCKVIEKEVKNITEEIDNYLEMIERDSDLDHYNLAGFESLENCNNDIFNIAQEQSDIVNYIRENVNAMLDIQSSLNSKIDFQNQDIVKIFNNFNKVIEDKEILNEAIKKIGNYSSLSHTHIEVLSNIINAHKSKSSITFAPIIYLFKDGK